MTRNSAALASFVKHCEEYPELRFWQALASWSGYSFVFVGSNLTMLDVEDAETLGLEDTFFWEGRTKEEGRHNLQLFAESLKGAETD